MLINFELGHPDLQWILWKIMCHGALYTVSNMTLYVVSALHLWLGVTRLGTCLLACYFFFFFFFVFVDFRPIIWRFTFRWLVEKWWKCWNFRVWGGGEGWGGGRRQSQELNDSGVSNNRRFWGKRQKNAPFLHNSSEHYFPRPNPSNEKLFPRQTSPKNLIMLGGLYSDFASTDQCLGSKMCKHLHLAPVSSNKKFNLPRFSHSCFPPLFS